MFQLSESFLGVAESVPATPLDLFEGWGPCFTQQLFHHLVPVCWECDVYFPVEQCCGSVCVLTVIIHNFHFHILLPCCEFCGIFCNCGGELWRVIVHGYWTSARGSMLMQRIRQKSHLPGNGLLGIVRGFPKCCWLNLVSCGGWALHLFIRQV